MEIILGAACGFCRPRILRWCDSRGVGYVVGMPSNSVLAGLAAPAVEAAAALHRLNGGRQRSFDGFEYAAGT